LKVPYRALYAALILFMIIGAYSLNNNPVEVLLLLLFGVLGYGLRKLRFDTAPLILAFVLGGPIEFNLRQTMMLARDPLDYLMGRPIALTILAFGLLLIVLPMFSKVRQKLMVARAVNEL
ncbi:MAG: tripartite tricarboxylate transporter permease, partial [Hyphomicrobiales bacterium]